MLQYDTFNQYKRFFLESSLIVSGLCFISCCFGSRKVKDETWCRRFRTENIYAHLYSHFFKNKYMHIFEQLLYMRSDNKVRELTVCLLWQQWTETSVWFDDVGIPGLLFGCTERLHEKVRRKWPKLFVNNSIVCQQFTRSDRGCFR
jgi:hypothetical protein